MMLIKVCLITVTTNKDYLFTVELVVLGVMGTSRRHVNLIL